jgi:hypothetical protein
VGFQDLPDIHACRNAERVKDQLDRRPIWQKGISSIGTTWLITPLLP